MERTKLSMIVKALRKEYGLTQELIVCLSWLSATTDT